MRFEARSEKDKLWKTRVNYAYLHEMPLQKTGVSGGSF
jgi:hypothetical protein